MTRFIKVTSEDGSARWLATRWIVWMKESATCKDGTCIGLAPINTNLVHCAEPPEEVIRRVNVAEEPISVWDK